MKKWRKRIKEKRKMKRGRGERYSMLDAIFELLFWIPELLILPFRILFGLFRGIGKLIGNVWDFFN
jgi:hypothetical protein